MKWCIFGEWESGNCQILRRSFAPFSFPLYGEMAEMMRKFMALVALVGAFVCGCGIGMGRQIYRKRG